MQKLWGNLQQGLVDYCRHNGFRDVIFGLSGGLDSAVVSVLATEALGGKHVYALMMKTNHTSKLSLQIAAKLAQLNKFYYQEMDIQPLFEAQVRFFKNRILEAPQKTVLENIQARLRGQILMAYSNQFNDLVLACGNRSEAAMGYCTLYGDTCGGLMPIGNLYKSQIFDLAKWLNARGKIVLPKEVISRAPTAELSDGQKDEDSLPPYDVLDGILELYCDKHKTSDEIVASGYERHVVEWVVKQYHKTAFKRAQMPQALPVDI
ncbi:MAG: NAD(+) synthase [Alphaproteobacteria bacterium]|nr:NAD(+) synthase [Alphaproteobacteria bacterium]